LKPGDSLAIGGDGFALGGFDPAAAIHMVRVDAAAAPAAPGKEGTGPAAAMTATSAGSAETKDGGAGGAGGASSSGGALWTTAKPIVLPRGAPLRYK
jgi:hypothetical protein